MRQHQGRRATIALAFGLAFGGFSSALAITGIFAVVTTFSLPACTLKESEAGASCGSATGNQGSGETICGTSTCQEGNYCITDAGNGCAPGCTVTAQCPSGATCDLTSAKPDIEGNLVGACTQPTLQEQSGAACEDGGSDASPSSKDAAK